MYIILSLLLVMVLCIIAIVDKPKAKTLSMLDLREFKDLPYEIRAALRRLLPDSQTVRRKWGSLTPEQKALTVQQLAALIPSTPKDFGNKQFAKPEFVKHEPVEPEPAVKVEPEPEPEPVETEAPALKKGFLLGVDKNKKKNTKNKKEDKVITLSVSPDSPVVENDGFLGSDE